MIVDLFAQLVVGSMGAALLARVACLLSSEDKSRRVQLKMLRSITGKRYPILFFFGTKKKVANVLAEVHPRGPEIKEHKTMLEGLKKIPGKKADDERLCLEKAIRELYAAPRRMAEIDGDAYMAYMEPYLEQLAAVREEADKAFFDERARKLGELNS